MISTYSGEQHDAGARHAGSEQQRPVTAACQRLAMAVVRLEEAVDSALGEGGTRHDADLQAAREEARSLRATQQTVSDRLDAAVGRLRALLNE